MYGKVAKASTNFQLILHRILSFYAKSIVLNEAHIYQIIIVVFSLHFVASQMRAVSEKRAKNKKTRRHKKNTECLMHIGAKVVGKILVTTRFIS
jgi:hypothetical protein